MYLHPNFRYQGRLPSKNSGGEPSRPRPYHKGTENTKEERTTTKTKNN